MGFASASTGGSITGAMWAAFDAAADGTHFLGAIRACPTRSTVTPASVVAHGGVIFTAD